MDGKNPLLMGVYDCKYHFCFEITSSCCPWLKYFTCLSSFKVLTAADIVTVVAIAAVVVAGMVAVSEAVVVVVVEMIETTSNQGYKWDFSRGKHSNFFKIPHPIPPLIPQLFHCPLLNINYLHRH